ncbi:hypothetical protein MKY96_32695 [Paenibacillus sp. FSL R7-0302]|uniref:hypothetical protein n=1 Tax=Paenibacillus sp. FSL R7-0302 TaxID=2921681 RepID=UPI0030F9D006
MNPLDFGSKGVNVYNYKDGKLEKRSVVDQRHFDFLMDKEGDKKIVLECSTVGDKRFSSFGAKVNCFGWDDIVEFHYFTSKGFTGVAVPNIKRSSWSDKMRFVNAVKGIPADYMVLNGKAYDADLLPQWYHLLWIKYLDRNPVLVEYLNQFDDFNDVFKGSSVSCQADSIRKYIKDGRESLMQECSELLEEMRGK